MTAIPIYSAVIEAARLVGIGVVARTPITESAALSERYGDEIIVFEEGLGLVPGLIRRNETKAG
jgi:threonine dehydratase